MRVKFYKEIVDQKGNTIYSNQKIKDIDIITKGEKYIWGIWFTKDETNKSIRSDGSLAIAWQIEYFDNLFDLKALHCDEKDCQKVSIFKYIVKPKN